MCTILALGVMATPNKRELHYMIMQVDSIRGEPPNPHRALGHYAQVMNVRGEKEVR